MNNNKKVRDSNFEILRILSMFMIVVLHISTHGINNYIDISESLNGFSEILYYFIRSLAIISVSLYVLISGYFLSTSTFKPIKLINLFLETSFFSTSLYLLTVIGGYSDFNINTLLRSMFSIITGEYWFVTVYFALYIFSPLLNKLIDSMTNKEYLYLLTTSFLMFNVWDFLFNSELIGVHSGYGLIYFIFLYFLAAYIKKYGFVIKDFSKHTYLLVYLALALANSLVTIAVEDFSNLYHYNAPWVLIMSYCLFMYFKNINIKSTKINFVSKYVFGIYLVHEQVAIREIIWNELGIVEDIIASDGILFIAKMLGYSLIVFIASWIASYVLTSLFNFLYKKISLKEKIMDFY